MRRRIVPLCLLASVAAVCLGGCGQSAREKRDIAQAERVTQEYAMAHGPHACSLLTNHAVKALYGNWTTPAPLSRAICRRRSPEFRGERVTFTRSELLDKDTIKVNALDQDKKFSYQVNLRRGRGGRWRIDLVSQARVTE
jgi:hypothetical protein